MIKVNATYDPEIRQLVTRLQKFDYNAVAAVANKQFAIEFVKILRDGIMHQDFRQPALSKRWKAQKQSSGQDPRRLIQTGAYLASIDAFPAKGGGYVVGTSNPLAVVHEYGYRSIPARPHWRPALRRWAATIPNETYKEIITKYLYTGALPLVSQAVNVRRGGLLTAATKAASLQMLGTKRGRGK